jgi:molybdopterin-synthase adenylyltransferase
MKNIQASLTIPPNLWQQVRQSMLSARQDDEETIGFLLCDRLQISKQHSRFIPREWVVPTADCYEYQSATGLALEQEFHCYLIDRLVANPNLHIVHIHTHSGSELPHFSAIDDRAESEYARFLSRHLQTKSRLISGVFDENIQQGQFRLWNRRGSGFQPVPYHYGWTQPPIEPHEPHDPRFARQQVFGSGCQQQLAQLQVALIGCGGIGSILAETLGRLGVKNWILVDPDRIEAVNLNRMPAATIEMVEQRWPKVDYVKHLIKRIYPSGSTVKTICAPLHPDLPDIATADLIIVATDNHASRQMAQEIALKTMRPLVSVGTHIEITPDRQPRLYARVTIPPLGGHWCLMCGNIINLHQAALENAPMSISQMAANQGYLADVPAPSVFWLNELSASMAAGAIHGILGGFVNADAGLDWVFDFAGGQWLKTDVDSLAHPHCFFCGTLSS